MSKCIYMKILNIQRDTRKRKARVYVWFNWYRKKLNLPTNSQ